MAKVADGSCAPASRKAMCPAATKAAVTDVAVGVAADGSGSTGPATGDGRVCGIRTRMRAAVAGTCSTSTTARAGSPPGSAPGPAAVAPRPGLSRVWLQPLSGLDLPGELQWMDPPGGWAPFCTKMRIGALPTPDRAIPRGATSVGDREGALGHRERPALAFRKDESRVRTGHAPRNLCLLRRMALNLLRQDATVRAGVAIRRRKAGRDLTYMEQMPDFVQSCGCRYSPCATRRMGPNPHLRRRILPRSPSWTSQPAGEWSRGQ